MIRVFVEGIGLSDPGLDGWPGAASARRICRHTSRRPCAAAGDAAAAGGTPTRRKRDPAGDWRGCRSPGSRGTGSGDDGDGVYRLRAATSKRSTISCACSRPIGVRYRRLASTTRCTTRRPGIGLSPPGPASQAPACARSTPVSRPGLFDAAAQTAADRPAGHAGRLRPAVSGAVAQRRVQSRRCSRLALVLNSEGHGPNLLGSCHRAESLDDGAVTPMADPRPGTIAVRQSRGAALCRCSPRSLAGPGRASRLEAASVLGSASRSNQCDAQHRQGGDRRTDPACRARCACWIACRWDPDDRSFAWPRSSRRDSPVGGRRSARCDCGIEYAAQAMAVHGGLTAGTAPPPPATWRACATWCAMSGG